MCLNLTVKKGDRVAQLILEKIFLAELKELKVITHNQYDI